MKIENLHSEVSFDIVICRLSIFSIIHKYTIQCKTLQETLLQFDPNGRAIIDDNQGTNNAVKCVLKGVEKK